MSWLRKARLLGKFIGFNEDIQKLFNNFEERIVPFGYAGSDKEFAKVCKKMLDFKSAWDKWYEKRRKLASKDYTPKLEKEK